MICLEAGDVDSGGVALIEVVELSIHGSNGSVDFVIA